MFVGGVGSFAGPDTNTNNVDITLTDSLTLAGIPGPGGPGGDAYFGGDLAELIEFNRTLSDADIRRVSEALGGEYNLTPIPEPASLGLLAVGGLTMLRRRR